MKDHYTYRVTWLAEDDKYVGLCAEFPSLSWLAPTLEEASAKSSLRLLKICWPVMKRRPRQ